MNSLNDEELNKINKLKQKLYSRSITNKSSGLNSLHRHDIQIPKNWSESDDLYDSKKNNIDNINIINKDSKNISKKDNENKESVADFLIKKFKTDNADDFGQVRAEEIENKIKRTNAELKIAQAKLSSQSSQLYPNLNKNIKNINDLNISDNQNGEFQSDYHPNMNTVLIGENADIQNMEKLNQKKKKKINLTVGFIIFMFIFFFFVGVAFYTYVNITKGVNTISTNKIDIKVTGPVNVKSGEVNDFIVDITNKNTTDLILSDLIVQYPDGSKSPEDRTKDLTNERISVGTIKPGETVRRKNSVVLFGEQNVNKNIKYSYEFNINDSTTVFKTEKDISVSIAGSPINITVNNVKEINNNQELIFDIDINSNTEEVLKNIQLKIEYPFGYKLMESSPKPVADNNIWSFDTIEPLSSTTIRLKGKFVGEINVEKNFRFILGIEDEKTKDMLTVLSTQDTQVAIRKPFIVTKLLIDGNSLDNYPVSYDQDLKLDLIVTNNFKDIINDVVVELALNGILIDRNSIKAEGGFYDSNRDVLFWDKSLKSSLSSIPPGESRELSFNISTINSNEELIKQLRRSVSDLTINVKAQRLGENRVSENVLASTKKQLKLKTDVLFTSSINYEKGVYPAEVGKETIYKYIGNITNTSNMIKDVIFTAKLPPNTVWKNIYGSNVNIPSSSIKYNSSTREISINLADIESGTGIDKDNREFYFYVGFTPTLTQSGQKPNIIINPTLSATDTFTGDMIRFKKTSLTTQMTNGQYSDMDGKVK